PPDRRARHAVERARIVASELPVVAAGVLAALLVREALSAPGGDLVAPAVVLLASVGRAHAEIAGAIPVVFAVAAPRVAERAGIGALVSIAVSGSAAGAAAPLPP